MISIECFINAFEWVWLLILIVCVVCIPIGLSKLIDGNEKKRISIYCDGKKVNSISIPLKLGSEKTTCLHWFIENLVFFRLQSMKNNPRGNWIFVRSVLTVFYSVFWFSLLFASICFFLIPVPYIETTHCLKLLTTMILQSACADKILITFPALVGAISAYTWHQSNLFHNQWKYCAEQFNHICRHTKKSDLPQLKINLAVDLILMDLWAQRAFSDFFADAFVTTVYEKFSGQRTGI